MASDAEFNAAVQLIQNLPKDGPFQPSNDLKLKLYAYYKQAVLGSCDQARPAFWDVVGRAKWDAWNQLGRISKDSAKQSYVNLLREVVDTMALDADVERFLKIGEQNGDAALNPQTVELLTANSKKIPNGETPHLQNGLPPGDNHVESKMLTNFEDFTSFANNKGEENNNDILATGKPAFSSSSVDKHEESTNSNEIYSNGIGIGRLIDSETRNSIHTTTSDDDFKDAIEDERRQSSEETDQNQASGEGNRSIDRENGLIEKTGSPDSDASTLSSNGLAAFSSNHGTAPAAASSIAPQGKDLDGHLASPFARAAPNERNEIIGKLTRSSSQNRRALMAEPLAPRGRFYDGYDALLADAWVNWGDRNKLKTPTIRVRKAKSSGKKPATPKGAGKGENGGGPGPSDGSPPSRKSPNSSPGARKSGRPAGGDQNPQKPPHRDRTPRARNRSNRESGGSSEEGSSSSSVELLEMDPQVSDIMLKIHMDIRGLKQQLDFMENVLMSQQQLLRETLNVLLKRQLAPHTPRVPWKFLFFVLLWPMIVQVLLRFGARVFRRRRF